MDSLAVFARVNGSDLEFVDKASGTVVAAFRANQVVDLSGSLGGVAYKKVTLTAAQVKALHGTPITLIADPGTGKFIQLIDALIYVNFNSASYAAGSAVNFMLNSVIVAATTAALLNAAGSASADIIQPSFPQMATSAAVGAANGALTITAAGSEFTTGDSPVDVHLWYSIVTL